MLHITNGDVASGLLVAAGMTGDIMAWDDVLHEGPVPAGLYLEGLSEVRAAFIADAGWAPRQEVEEKFARRDGMLRARVHTAGEIVLWFEADMYDQLQLVQVLDLLGGELSTLVPASLIEIEGQFGARRPDEVRRLFDGRSAVEERHFVVARRAWQAFRMETPEDLQALAEEDHEGLRFLAPALRRHLEEFPSLDSGLTRTEWQMLAGIAGHSRTAAALFKVCLDHEERPFMGDTVFLWLLEALAAGSEPLLGFRNASRTELDRYPGLKWRTALDITDAGKQVLSGRSDWMTISGRQLWRGGVRVDRDNDWRHDPATGLVATRMKAGERQDSA